MDPNATLAELRRLSNSDAAKMGDWSMDYANRRCQKYSELINALDEWITGGGFLPHPWTKVRSVTVTGDKL